MNWKTTLLAACLAASVAGCDTLMPNGMLTNGELTHFRVADDGSLRGAWFDAFDPAAAIPARAGNDQPETPDQVFELVFDTGFIKYLPDFGGLNEVVVVFTFADGPVDKDENKIVKILGPMRRQPDGAILPDISRITFGPTALESRYLTVNVKVVEFDREEAEDNAAFIDFVGNAAEHLAIADPVTASEIAIAKEIGKTLADANQNDIVLDATFELIPYEEDVWSRPDNQNSIALPLRTGVFGVIKTEKPFKLFTFFPFTRSLWTGGPNNGFEWVGFTLATPISAALDVVALPFTGILRGLADVPDSASLDPITQDDDGCYRDLIRGAPTRLRFDANERRIVGTGESHSFESKSWLTFSVTRGHDALPLEVRRRLTETDQKIVEMLKNRSLKDVLADSGILAAIDEHVKRVKEAAEKAKAAVENAKTVEGFKLIAPEKGRMSPIPPKSGVDPVKPLEIQFSAPAETKPVSIALCPREVESDAKFERLPGDLGCSVASAWNATFTLPERGLGAGRYVIEITSEKDGVKKTVELPLRVVNVPTLELTEDAQKKTWESGKSMAVVLVTSGNLHDLSEVEAQCVDAASTSTQVTLKFSKSDPGMDIANKIITLKNSDLRALKVKKVIVRRGKLDPAETK